jgi:hypothetical protein
MSRDEAGIVRKRNSVAASSLSGVPELLIGTPDRNSLTLASKRIVRAEPAPLLTNLAPGHSR